MTSIPGGLTIIPLGTRRENKSAWFSALPALTGCGEFGVYRAMSSTTTSEKASNSFNLRCTADSMVRVDLFEEHQSPRKSGLHDALVFHGPSRLVVRAGSSSFIHRAARMTLSCLVLVLAVLESDETSAHRSRFHVKAAAERTCFAEPRGKTSQSARHSNYKYSYNNQVRFASANPNESEVAKCTRTSVSPLQPDAPRHRLFAQIGAAYRSALTCSYLLPSRALPSHARRHHRRPLRSSSTRSSDSLPIISRLLARVLLPLHARVHRHFQAPRFRQSDEVFLLQHEEEDACAERARDYKVAG